MPGNTIYQIVQDSSNNYWIATSSGVARYNGETFKVFGTQNGLPYDDIWWVLVDGSKVWLITYGNKLYYIEGDSLGFRDLEPLGVSEDAVTAQLFRNELGDYWLGFSSAIQMFNDTATCFVPIRSRPGSEPAWPQYVVTASGEFYAVKLAPVSVLKTGPNGCLQLKHEYDASITVETEPIVDSGMFYVDSVTVIVRSPDSIYLVYEEKLLGLINGEMISLGYFPTRDRMLSGYYDVKLADNKFFFISKLNTFVTDLNFNHLPEYDFISKLNVNSIFVDAEGGLWIYTLDNGVYFLSSSAVTSKSFGESWGLQSQVASIDKDSLGRVWMALRDGSICLCQAGGPICQQVQVRSVQKMGQLIVSMAVIDDQLFALTVFSELHHLQIADNPKAGALFTTRSVRPFSAKSQSMMKTLSKNPNKNLFLGGLTWNYKLTLAEDDYDFDTILGSSIRSYAITQDHLNTTYLGSISGIHMIDSSDNDISAQFDYPILRAQVTDMEQYDLDRIWVATMGQGVYYIQGDTIKVPECNKNWEVNDIYLETKDSIWLSTNVGAVLLVYTIDECNTQIFTTADGLLTDKVTSICADNRFVYVGTALGITMLDKTRLQPITKVPEVNFTKLTVNGSPVKQASNYKLNYNENTITISFNSVSPSRDGHLNYRYRLQGLENEWQQATDGVASYPYVPPGSYKFVVKAVDNNQVASEPIGIDITIDELWYTTTEFYVATVFIMFLTLLATYQLRINQIKKQKRRENELNKKFAELELSALQAQMNPHFVFNVLHAIQDCIINNDMEDASRYLVEFSKLMRLFLESSDDRYIRLDKEIELIKLYVGLEKMRFQDKFDLELKVDEEMDTSMLRLPSMLLQPIVENAISHGLKYKTEKGLLTIEIQEPEEGVLYITVEDNGIGRQQSEIIKQKNRKGHISKGQQLVQDRLETLRAAEGADIKLIYTDIKEENIVKGTRVELKLNLEINK